jgi:hypothetical protein
MFKKSRIMTRIQDAGRKFLRESIAKKIRCILDCSNIFMDGHGVALEFSSKPKRHV